MAAEKCCGMVLIIAFVLGRGAIAQSRCPSKVMGLSSCVTYITRNSSTPSPSCCQSLDSLVKSQPECLCPLLSNGVGFSLGIALNRTLALALPAACNMNTPPVSQCSKLANGPATAPVTSPSPLDAIPEPPESSTTTTAPSGSATIPDIDGTTSRGSTAALPLYDGFFAILIAAWITNTHRF